MVFLLRIILDDSGVIALELGPTAGLYPKPGLESTGRLERDETDGCMILSVITEERITASKIYVVLCAVYLNGSVVLQPLTTR